MKKFFITGLIILLPLTLTIAIVLFIFHLLTVPFLGIVKAVFGRYHILNEGFLFLNADQIQTLVAEGLILVSLFFSVILLGFIARWFFIHKFLKFADFYLRKIPLVSAIYKACQEMIHSLFTSDAKSFKLVVLAPFPSPETFSIGFITRDEIPGLIDTLHAESISVFVPTAPNPTSGFLMLFKPKDLIYLDMRVEDAFKYIISCGVIYPPFKVITKEQAYQSIGKQELSPSPDLEKSA